MTAHEIHKDWCSFEGCVTVHPTKCVIVHQRPICFECLRDMLDENGGFTEMDDLEDEVKSLTRELEETQSYSDEIEAKLSDANDEIDKLRQAIDNARSSLGFDMYTH